VVSALVFLLALAAVPAPQAGVRDADVAKGIHQLEDGDYDAAIFTLDAAAQRLSASGALGPDLAQAYLHLGIGYVAKGAEVTARAKFREALKQASGLNLSPENYPPKVIEVFEAARQESESQAAAVPAAEPHHRGGAGKALLIVGGVAAAGAGVAIAAGGGGDNHATTTTPPPASGSRQTETFTDNVGFNESLTYTIHVAVAGPLDSTLTWPEPHATLALDLHLPGSIVASSTRTGTTGAALSANVGAQTYALQVSHRGDACVPSAQTPQSPPCATSFTLSVTHP
jgi:hypothetical protein